MSLLLSTKQILVTSSLSKKIYVDVLKGDLNSTSICVPAQLTKDKLLLHHIDSQTKIDVKMDKCELPTFYWLPRLHINLYKSRFISNSSHCSTTIFSKHITSAQTAVKDHVIKYSETAFSNSNVNYFWSIKTLPRSSKSCDYVTFRVLKYLLSTFPLYTPHYHMLLSKQKCCLLLTGVSTHSQKRTSVLRAKRGFFFGNNKYDSYKWVMWSFYLPHGKHKCAIWRNGISTNSGDSYRHKLGSTLSRLICFYFVIRGILYLTFPNLNNMTV